jgi:predicted DNA-binding transcriptional regulator YafY
MLQDMGIPIEAERGRFGGYRLRPGFRLPPLMFNEEEALALTLGMLTVQQLKLSASTSAVEGVLAKLERVLPLPLREQVQAIKESVSFALWNDAPLPSNENVLALSKGVHENRQVWLRYSAWRRETTERVVDPYGLVYQGGRWYVAGWCHLRQGLRVFRIDRINRVELLKRTFSPPPDFDPVEYVVQTLASTPYTWSVEVLLEATLEEAKQRVSPALGLLEEQPEGVLLKAQADTLSWAASYLVGLDIPFTVIKPQELKEELGRLAERIKSWAGLETPMSRS